MQRDRGIIIDPQHPLFPDREAELGEEAPGRRRLLGGPDLGELLGADPWCRIVPRRNPDQHRHGSELLAVRIEQEQRSVGFVDNQIGQPVIVAGRRHPVVHPQRRCRRLEPGRVGLGSGGLGLGRRVLALLGHGPFGRGGLGLGILEGNSGGGRNEQRQPSQRE